MRLLINGRALLQEKITGVQRYAQNIVSWFDRLGVKYAVATPSARSRAGRHLWEQFSLPRLAGGYDVLFCPANLAPVRSVRPARLVVTLHSVAFAAMPRMYRRSFRRYYRWIVPRVVRRADAVITVSKTERRRIVQFYPDAAEKLHVVPHGVDETFLRAETARTDPYVLFVGGLGVGKNLPAALEAVSRLGENFNVRVVIVGGHLDILRRDRGIAGAARRLGGGRVAFRGAATDAGELAGLYAGAAVLVLPSLYESFGLPALEAMACGTPVVASDLPALREVVGPAGVLVDPHDVDALTAAVRKILGDESFRRRLGRFGRQRASRFSWRRCAEQTLAVLRRVAEW